MLGPCNSALHRTQTLGKREADEVGGQWEADLTSEYFIKKRSHKKKIPMRVMRFVYTSEDPWLRPLQLPSEGCPLSPRVLTQTSPAFTDNLPPFPPLVSTVTRFVARSRPTSKRLCGLTSAALSGRRLGTRCHRSGLPQRDLSILPEADRPELRGDHRICLSFLLLCGERPRS